MQGILDLAALDVDPDQRIRREVLGGKGPAASGNSTASSEGAVPIACLADEIGPVPQERPLPGTIATASRKSETLFGGADRVVEAVLLLCQVGEVVVCAERSYVETVVEGDPERELHEPDRLVRTPLDDQRLRVERL